MSELVAQDGQAVAPMSMLTDAQKSFVEHYCALGGRKGIAARAAIMAGYAQASAASSAYRLLHDKKILAAIRWHVETRFRAAAMMAMNTLEELAEAGPAEVRLRAANSILDRAGMLIPKFSEHHVVVRDERTDAETVAYIREQARKHNMSPELLAAMLGPAADILDAEFEEVAEDGEPW